MIRVPVYSMDGGLVEEMEVEESYLGGRVNRDVLRQAIVTYEANQRRGTAKTKTRSEVSYSNKKPWRQKHTGRARAGTRASPLWVGGGTTFGPVPRDFSKKLNKKMRRKALASALLAKLQAGEIKVLDGLEILEPKTREMVRIVRNLGVNRTFLIVLPRHDALLWRCTRNIPGAAMMNVRELNPYQVLRAREIIFTREAFDQLLGAAREAAASAPAPGAPPAEGE